jgi:hypothetical protein
MRRTTITQAVRTAWPCPIVLAGFAAPGTSRAASPSDAPDSASTRPANVVLLVADDLGFSDFASFEPAAPAASRDERCAAGVAFMGAVAKSTFPKRMIGVVVLAASLAGVGGCRSCSSRDPRTRPRRGYPRKHPIRSTAARFPSWTGRVWRRMTSPGRTRPIARSSSGRCRFSRVAQSLWRPTPPTCAGSGRWPTGGSSAASNGSSSAQPGGGRQRSPHSRLPYERNPGRRGERHPAEGGFRIRATIRWNEEKTLELRPWGLATLVTRRLEDESTLLWKYPGQPLSRLKPICRLPEPSSSGAGSKGSR